jgi:hypothetical protein
MHLENILLGKPFRGYGLYAENNSLGSIDGMANRLILSNSAKIEGRLLRRQNLRNKVEWQQWFIMTSGGGFEVSVNEEMIILNVLPF